MNHGPGLSHPPYPSGLILAGRRVVIVGGGRVAARRLQAFIDAGAAVTVVSPEVDPAVREAANAGTVTLLEREYAPGDLSAAWYAMASTDRPAVNAAVLEEATAARIFCVRADDAPLGTAWTPAVGHHQETTVAVLANRDPERSRRTRDRLLEALRSPIDG
ncbi:bifunctional precorrin-2 dehydrogenase/sirohydrochlorin ferrochelatase [Mumia zhuanghuii]|uniref:precorrin-2 dehydrogenase n=2 Tax=Mumia TaxID=1546255 RepID=A0ABW1QJB1_9ACTN|nr:MULTISPECIES: bifunctional precorrin-2 dehydrogenase/sirohydrochlorin ferrochelatase [Mumia]KAA1419940.1 bifunctional precorrin-2 dehydrogenase/sirohydrochlorin ferrochelatase [Mumia zhuanghuii]